jgi:hypothetical protein
VQELHKRKHIFLSAWFPSAALDEWLLGYTTQAAKPLIATGSQRTIEACSRLGPSWGRLKLVRDREAVGLLTST